MNPRYLAYCRSRGMTPEDVEREDEVAYPGGPMAGYQIWISEKYGEFRTATRKKGNFSAQDYAEFDEWLRRADAGREGDR